jgi:hypothetical protein
MDGENATNAKGETSLLEKLEADRKRKITPIKIKKLAMKKQKLEKKEKPKTPRKKKEKKVESMDLSSSAQPEPVNPSPPTSSSTEVVAQSSTNNNMDATPPAQSLQGEKQFDPSSLVDKKTKTPVFNDKNCDYNVYTGDPNNVVCKKVRIDKNLILTCRMIEANEGRKTNTMSYSEYAALSFVRKMRDDRAFEFNLPLNLAPAIIEGLQLIMNDNPRFFKK